MHVRGMKAVLLGNGMQPNFRFFVAQLQAAVRLEDVQVLLAWFLRATPGALQQAKGHLC